MSLHYTSSADKNVCTECIGNEFFSKWIAENGEAGTCDYDESHRDENSVISLEELAEYVDQYFRANYCQGAEYRYGTPDSDNPSYANYGEPYKDILENDLECSQTLIEELSSYLPDDDGRDGGETFYDDCMEYESLSDAQKREEAEWEDHWYEDRFAYPWYEFCDTVKYKRRFFRTIELLNALFGKAEEYESGTVRPIYQVMQGAILHRARLLDNTFTEAMLNENPAINLSAPPRDKTKAGRMNVEFIPVFYASFSPETALAEMRPSIGDSLAIGEYRLTRPIKVFDFTAFDSLEYIQELSNEERARAYAHTRYDFIQHVQDEISKPVTQHQKQLEYIPTQIIAEYLSEHFGCDAIIYKSSIFRQRNATARNIVLFNKGGDFVGAANSILDYIGHKIKRISDVTYATTNEKNEPF